jgi:energy-coupling factor transport system ATP-binding protein
MSIQLENINYIYGIGSGYEKQALKNINLEIRDGEFIGLVGHTGSGKSTLTHLLNGLETPTTGNVYYNHKNIRDKDFSRKELRSKVGLVFQYPEYQLFEVSVLKDVEFGPRNMGLSNLEVEKRSFDALKQMGISDDLLDVSPLQLSGGQKRRVAIAGVLAMEPEILVLDEPTAGLDPAGREEILGLLTRLHQEKNITILFVSHSMDDVARYTQRVLVMHRGELVLEGEPGHIFQYEEELQKIGLGVPQSTRIMHLLKKAGADVNGSILTPEEAAEEIADYLKKKASSPSDKTGEAMENRGEERL